jgi:hypothetical protein
MRNLQLWQYVVPEESMSCGLWLLQYLVHLLWMTMYQLPFVHQNRVIQSKVDRNFEGT